MLSADHKYLDTTFVYTSGWNTNEMPVWNFVQHMWLLNTSLLRSCHVCESIICIDTLYISSHRLCSNPMLQALDKKNMLWNWTYADRIITSYMLLYMIACNAQSKELSWSMLKWLLPLDSREEVIHFCFHKYKLYMKDDITNDFYTCMLSSQLCI